MSWHIHPRSMALRQLQLCLCKDNSKYRTINVGDSPKKQPRSHVGSFKCRSILQQTAPQLITDCVRVDVGGGRGGGGLEESL